MIAVIIANDPVPLVAGDRIRTLELARALRRAGHDVHLLASVSAAFAVDEAGRDALESVYTSHVTYPRRRRRLQRIADLTAAYGRGRAIHHRYFWCPDVATRISGRLEELQPDFVLISQLYAVPYVPRAWLPRSVLDTQNVEADRVAAMARGVGIRPAVARRTLAGTVAYEREVVSEVLASLVVSRDDANSLHAAAPGRVIIVPNGFTAQARSARHETQPPTFLFVGSLTYSANRDAVGYLLRDVLPRTRTAVKIVVAGAGAPARLRRQAARAAKPVEILGFVNDLRPLYASARALVVPVAFGGGTRIKILDALAAGVPVISTTVGAAGLPLTAGRDFMAADTADAFAAAIDQLALDEVGAAEIGRRGPALAEPYRWSSTAEPLVELFRHCGAMAASASWSPTSP